MAVTTYEFKGVMKYASYNVLDNNNIVAVSSDESDAFASINSTTTMAIIVLLGILAISLVVSFVSGRKIARPLVVLSGLVEKIAGGDMNVDYSVIKLTNDEVGLIASNIKGMTDTLNEIIVKIRKASESMSQQSS